MIIKAKCHLGKECVAKCQVNDFSKNLMFSLCEEVLMSTKATSLLAHCFIAIYFLQMG